MHPGKDSRSRRRRRRSRVRRKEARLQKDSKPPRRRRRTRVRRRKALVRFVALSAFLGAVGFVVYFWFVQGENEEHVVIDSVGDLVAVLLPITLLAAYLVPTVRYGRFLWFRRVAQRMRA